MGLPETLELKPPSVRGVSRKLDWKQRRDSTLSILIQAAGDPRSGLTLCATVPATLEQSLFTYSEGKETGSEIDSSQDYARLKPRARNIVRISHVGAKDPAVRAEGRAETQTQEHTRASQASSTAPLSLVLGEQSIIFLPGFNYMGLFMNPCQ